MIGASLATMAMMQLILLGNDAFRVTRSAADLAAALQAETQPPYDAAAPVYQLGFHDQTLPFYLRRPTTLVDYRDEFSLGLDAEPQKAIPTVDAWVAQWQRLPQGYAVVGGDTLAAITAQGVPFRVVARDPRRLLVARR